jgi:hypothetical protein
MKLEIPLYCKVNDVYKIARDKNGEQELITLELSDYVVRIQDLENVKELTEEFNKPSQYVDFVNTIKTFDLLPLFREKYDTFKEDWARTIKGVPQHIIDKLKQNRIEFEKLLATELKHSMSFLKEHIIDIENLFKEIIEEQKNKIKQSRKTACKKYYLKKKQELNVSFDTEPENIELTEEEIIEKQRKSRQETNHKYYLKRKEQIILNPSDEEKVSEIKSKKAEANKKWYEKRKQLLQSCPREVKTPEEIKESRKEAQHKYYLKKKELMKSDNLD